MISTMPVTREEMRQRAAAGAGSGGVLRRLTGYARIELSRPEPHKRRGRPGRL